MQSIFKIQTVIWGDTEYNYIKLQFSILLYILAYNYKKQVMQLLYIEIQFMQNDDHSQ